MPHQLFNSYSSKLSVLPCDFVHHSPRLSWVFHIFSFNEARVFLRIFHIFYHISWQFPPPTTQRRFAFLAPVSNIFTRKARSAKFLRRVRIRPRNKKRALNSNNCWYPLAIQTNMERSHHFLMAKSTISMVMFHSKLLVYQRVNISIFVSTVTSHFVPWSPYVWWLKHCCPWLNHHLVGEIPLWTTIITHIILNIYPAIIGRPNYAVNIPSMR